MQDVKRFQNQISDYLGLPITLRKPFRIWKKRQLRFALMQKNMGKPKQEQYFAPAD